jgi:hypothetical protein|tara:strand:- start:304 stop:462 length:159 start_codon:yes stop_codon:yes gene_type:complete
MLVAATPVVAGVLEDGLAAYDAGNYRKAFQQELQLPRPTACQNSQSRFSRVG